MVDFKNKRNIIISQYLSNTTKKLINISMGVRRQRVKKEWDKQLLK